MAMIKGVIFDMDGVMVDTERQLTEGYEAVAKQIGIEIPRWLTDSFKGASHELSERHFNDYFKGKIDYWEIRKLRDKYVDKLREKEGIPVKKGLFELLNYIKDNGMVCAVATSTKHEVAENILKDAGAWPYLNAMVYGDEVKRGKPEPDIFLKAAKDLGLDTSEVIVIEDSINGIRAGHAAGIKVVHVPDMIKIDDDVKALTYKVCDSLNDVIAIIEELNK